MHDNHSIDATAARKRFEQARHVRAVASQMLGDTRHHVLVDDVIAMVR